MPQKYNYRIIIAKYLKTLLLFYKIKINKGKSDTMKIVDS